MKEAINNYYLLNDKIEEVKNFVDEKSDKKNIIYEVFRIVDGVPVFLDEHIKRMEKSFGIVNINFPFTYEELKDKVYKVTKANEDIVGNLKISFNTIEKTLKIYYIKNEYPTKEMYEKGVKTILYYGERENPNAKIVTSSFREGIDKERKEKNAYDVLLVDRNKNITEASRSNVFFIKNNTLITAPGKAVLLGVTRAKVILVATELNIKIEEREVNIEEIKEMEAIFISGTSPKVLPIAYVDDIAMDVNNSILRDIMSKFNELEKNYIDKF